jgi:hypothetical protein
MGQLLRSAGAFVGIGGGACGGLALLVDGACGTLRARAASRGTVSALAARSATLSTPLTAALARARTPLTVGARLGCGGRAVNLQEGVATLALDHVALVEPHLYADAAIGGVGVYLAVVNIGADGVEGHAAFHLPHGAGHFGTT